MNKQYKQSFICIFLLICISAGLSARGIFEKIGRADEAAESEISSGNQASGPAPDSEETGGDPMDDAADDDSVPETAVLQQGPEFRKGIPFFPPNAIPVFIGAYRFRDRDITVYYTEKQIPRGDEWNELVCGDTAALELPTDGGKVVIYPREQGTEWSMLFFHPAAGNEVLSQEEFCLFIDTFIRRFIYFRGISREKAIPPFPAVIPLE